MPRTTKPPRNSTRKPPTSPLRQQHRRASPELERCSHTLLEEIKQVGPDLKDVRLKLRKEWIPYWLGHTHTFRPTTKMPQFRLTEAKFRPSPHSSGSRESPAPRSEHQPPGNAAHGKELFEERGCLACHSIGEGANIIGGISPRISAASAKKKITIILSAGSTIPASARVPIARSRRKIIGPEDYAKHNLPYVFDLDHSTLPE